MVSKGELEGLLGIIIRFESDKDREGINEENKNYESPPIGYSFRVMFYGVDDKYLKDQGELEILVSNAVEKEKFKVLTTTNYNFNPGITMTGVISESHLAIHTYPEHNSLVLDLYACSGYKEVGIEALKYITMILNPKKIVAGPVSVVPVKELEKEVVQREQEEYLRYWQEVVFPLLLDSVDKKKDSYLLEVSPRRSGHL